MERTLSARFGDTYLRLELPVLPEVLGLELEGGEEEDLEVELTGRGRTGGISLDAALHNMAGALASCLRAFGKIDWQQTSWE